MCGQSTDCTISETSRLELRPRPVHTADLLSVDEGLNRTESELSIETGASSSQYCCFWGMTPRTPPAGFAVSPSYLGMICQCRCGTVWPAAGPSLIPTFNPSGLVSDRTCSIARSSVAFRDAQSAASRSRTCRFGNSNVWPSVTGYRSRIQQYASVWNTTSAAVSPATIEQNVHSCGVGCIAEYCDTETIKTGIGDTCSTSIPTAHRDVACQTGS